MTDNTQTEALRALAEAAKWTGKWYDAGCTTVHCTYDKEDSILHDEIAHPVPFGVSGYIAAAHPQAVIALLDRIAELESELEAVGAGGVSGPLVGRAAQAGGWRLVPVEPTTDQEWAGKRAVLRGLTMAAVRKIYKAMLAATPPTAQAEGWTKLPGQLPEPGMPVLLDIGKKYPIRAMWAAKGRLPVGDGDAGDYGEYDEDSDTYYCPEGWYEWNEHDEIHWRVTKTPRAWMPLPLPPTSAEGVEHG